MKNVFVLTMMLVMCCKTMVYGTTVEHKNSPQPKGVGLVLSGGGAKGLFHIGVIQALEENEIPINYIAGVSMGAIVGGLYASGWSVEKMTKFFKTDSATMWVSGKIPLEYSNYYAKFRPNAEMIGINIKADSSSNKNILQIPTNLIAPYMLDIAFNQLLTPPSSAANNNFDSLMIPFLCVATDIYKKEKVVFRKGPLPIAVRASMAIPMLFKALEVDSTLLYDGGILDNFPTKILIDEFNPEKIIGSICTGNFEQPKSDNLSTQITSLATRITDFSIPNPEKNVRIKQLMPDINILDYHLADSIIKRGYNKTMEMMPEIKKKITARRTLNEVNEIRKQFNAKIPELTFDSIEITGLSKAQTKYVRRQLGVNKQKQFTYEYFYDRYMRIIAAGVFTAEFPTINYNPNSGYYQIKLKMDTKAAMRVSLGGNISSSALNQAYVGFNYKHTTQVASTYGLEGDFGMFYNAVKLYGSHHVYTNRPYYFDYSASIEGYNFDGSNMKNYYKDVTWRYANKQDITLEASIAIPIFKTSAFKTSIEATNSQYKYFETLHTSADTASRSVFNYIKINPLIETNSINYPLYANKGTRQQFSIGYTLGLEDYSPGSVANKFNSHNITRWWIQANYFREQYVPLNNWLTLGYLIDVTVSNHPDFENKLITQITAPYFSPIAMTNTMFIEEFSAANFVGAGIMPTFNFLKSRLFYLKTYFYTFIPDGIFTQNQDSIGSRSVGGNKGSNIMDYIKFIYGGSLVYQTPIGPASLSISKFTTGPNNWAVQFNFGYTLFNGH